MTDKNINQAKVALILLTIVNYLNYIDRFILSAVLHSIQTDLLLTDTQAGLLATAFIVPYMFVAPVFGWLGDRYKRSKILGFGVTLWSIATFFTGFAKNFALIMTSRSLLGIGESAFTTTSIPFISDYYPNEKKGRALAILASALPVGAALGFVLGGLLSQSVGWRNAFYIVGFPGLVLSVFIFRLPEPRTDVVKDKFDIKIFLKTLYKSKTYMWNLAGYCCYTFVVGGVAHWIPSYIQRTFSVTEMKANILFGGIAVVSGLSGTLAGGWLGDYFQKQQAGGHLKISAWSMLVALPLFWFCISTQDLVVFMSLLGVTQFCFFLSTSPTNVALLNSVPAGIRTSAMAFSICLSHVLGDSISSPLMGAVSDATGSLQKGLMITVPFIFLTFVSWFLGMYAEKNKPTVHA